MSRIVTHNETFTGIPTSYDSTNSTVQNATSTQNGLNPVTNTGSSTYANFSLNSNGTQYAFYNFTVTGIPSNSVITSVSCSSRNSHYYQNRRYGNAYLQLFSNTTAKGSQTTVSATSTTATVYNLTSATTGSWTVSELEDLKLRITVNRTRSGYYVRFWGATLTVNYSWDETLYAISTSSSVQGVGISAQDNEVTSGGTDVITLTGVSSLSDIKLMDNGTDVTSSLVRSGSNYTYTLNGVDNDHTLTVESGIPKYSVNASSTYAGATIVANPTSVQEGSNCVLTLTTQYFTKVKVMDNGNDITSLFTGSNNTYTYTLTNVTTAHTIIVSEVIKTLYMNVENVMKSVNSIQKKVNGEWTTISMIDFWRKVNGNYANDTTVSGKTSLVYGGILETIVYNEIGTVNKSTSDLTITIDDNALQSGTYKMFYEDINRSIIDRIDEITEFTI